jgi:type II secretory pathway component GspD/PulD (secretin)
MAGTSYAANAEKEKDNDLNAQPQEITTVNDIVGDCTGTYYVVDPRSGQVIGSFVEVTQTKSEADCFDLVSNGTLHLADAYPEFDFRSTASFQ